MADVLHASAHLGDGAGPTVRIDPDPDQPAHAMSSLPRDGADMSATIQEMRDTNSSIRATSPVLRLVARQGPYRIVRRAAGDRVRLLPEQKLRGRLGVAGLGLSAHRRQRCDREPGRLHRGHAGFLGEAPAHEQYGGLELVFGTVGERFRPQDTAVGLGAFRTGSGPDLPQLTPRQRDQPRFGEAEHRFVGRRIDHLDVQRRGFAEAAFFLGDTLGRQGEHHQHRLVAVAHEDSAQRRAVRRHQVVAKLLDGA